MRNPQGSRRARAVDSVRTSEISGLLEAWYLEGQVRRLASGTMALHRLMGAKLTRFLEDDGIERVDEDALRAFMRSLSAYSPRYQRNLFVDCSTFFEYLVSEERLPTNPMRRIPKPKIPQDQIAPFSPEQVRAILAAAKESLESDRNLALVMLMLDTGARASEVCGLTYRDIDLGSNACRVLGKGGKTRMLPFSPSTGRALGRYIAQGDYETDDKVFWTRQGNPVDRFTLLEIVRHLGERAGVKGVRCSPHTFRHTFAVEFLRGGGNAPTLKELLGHTTLNMTLRYVALADADLLEQHRLHSPVERLMGRADARQSPRKRRA